jgi:hypothetical protein
MLTHDDDFMDNGLFPFSICSGVEIITGASGDENALTKAVAGVLAMFWNLDDFLM